MKKKVGVYPDARKKKPWVVRWFGEINPETGKPRRYSEAFKLKRDAEDFRAKKMEEFNKGQKRDKAEELTLEAYCRDWLSTKSPNYKPKTRILYETAIRRLCSYFGSDMALSKIGTAGAAKFIAEMKPLEKLTKLESADIPVDETEGKKKKKQPQKLEKLANSSRVKDLRNYVCMFNDAVEWEILYKNPFAKIAKPRVIRKPWFYLKPDGYRLLLTVAPDLYSQATYALGYTAGLRFGEMFSLMWPNIDFDSGDVLVDNRYGTELHPPFSVKDYEKRRIPIPKHTLDILARLQAEAPEGIPYVLLRKHQYETMLVKWKCYQSIGREWKNEDMVNNTGRELKRHLKWAGIKPIGTFSLHTLRKCCGKNWASHLPVNVVKELMGHSSISTTMEYYNQVDDEQRARAAQVVDKLVNPDELPFVSSQPDESSKSDAQMTPEARIGQERAE
ncbi:MAG: site-specific integrase [Planctomycetaceae bacterium]|nr:site-specific integrase [Planctomycetaceae bacterium]